MADDSTAGSQNDIRLVVPSATREKFPELVDLILQSQSMNTEERQYWIGMLPDMKDDQRTQLQTILVTERDQLAEIDKKFAIDAQQSLDAAQISEQRMERAKERAEKEDAIRKEEEEQAENALKEME